MEPIAERSHTFFVLCFDVLTGLTSVSFLEVVHCIFEESGGRGGRGGRGGSGIEEGLATSLDLSVQGCDQGLGLSPYGLVVAVVVVAISAD